MKINNCEILEANFEEKINYDDWVIMKHQWGKNNGGCVPENIDLNKDELILNANGDLYTGPIRGINHDKIPIDNGKRTGSVLMSRKALGPGRYEIFMKPCPEYGACSAFWTWYGDGKINHEIDIEIPGVLDDNPSFETMKNNTWVTEDDYENHNTKIDNVLDGNYHKFRFDWHTMPKRVEFYYDDTLVNVCTTNIPTIKGNINFGVWFPNKWAGNPNFISSCMCVKYFRYTPFPEYCEENEIDIAAEQGNFLTDENNK